MGMTNAEKQAAWRARQKNRVAELEAEVAWLRGELAKADPARWKPRGLHVETACGMPLWTGHVSQADMDRMAEKPKRRRAKGRVVKVAQPESAS